MATEQQRLISDSTKKFAFGTAEPSSIFSRFEKISIAVLSHGREFCSNINAT